MKLQFRKSMGSEPGSYTLVFASAGGELGFACFLTAEEGIELKKQMKRYGF
jgi:hypothetical protein